jgi:hypothetical protein
MTFLAFWLVFSSLVGVYAARKGRSGVGFFSLAVFVTPPIGFFLALLAEPRKARVVKPEEKINLPPVYRR